MLTMSDVSVMLYDFSEFSGRKFCFLRKNTSQIRYDQLKFVNLLC